MFTKKRKPSAIAKMKFISIVHMPVTANDRTFVEALKFHPIFNRHM